jgi:hypothetical protein
MVYLMTLRRLFVEDACHIDDAPRRQQATARNVLLQRSDDEVQVLLGGGLLRTHN